MMRKLIFILLIAYAPKLSAQISVKDSSISFGSFGFSYAYQTPSGDLAKRFGNNSNIGANFMYKLKSNWTFGIEATYLFGTVIKDTRFFDNLVTEKGAIIDEDGLEADVRLYERGATGMLDIGKIIPVLSPNPNSGLFFSVGAGFLQHKIRIELARNTDVGNVPQVTGDYTKGYDRLTNGLAIKAFAGYMYYGNRRMTNFFAGFEFIQAWTQNRRGYNYDMMQDDNAKRIDQLLGFRVGLIIPLYKKVPNQYYYR